jgi:hypothetical protein
MRGDGIASKLLVPSPRPWSSPTPRAGDRLLNGRTWDQGPDKQPDGDPCPSWQGRAWNAAQGFPGLDAGTDADPVTLRVPCGCTTAHARLWTVAAEQEGQSR